MKNIIKKICGFPWILVSAIIISIVFVAICLFYDFGVA